MTALNLPGILSHARNELTGAHEWLAQHQKHPIGLCTCMRVWPCNANLQAAAYIRYWEARLKVMEAEAMTRAMTASTMVLPQVVMA